MLRIILSFCFDPSIALRTATSFSLCATPSWTFCSASSLLSAQTFLFFVQSPPKLSVLLPCFSALPPLSFPFYFLISFLLCFHLSFMLCLRLSSLLSLLVSPLTSITSCLFPYLFPFYSVTFGLSVLPHRLRFVRQLILPAGLLLLLFPVPSPL